MPDLPGIGRRQFLVGASLVGGCLLVAPLGALQARTQAESGLDVFGPFLRFTPEGDVIVVSKHSELGQGAQSGLAAIVAEELDADWHRVRVEMSTADRATFAHTAVRGLQITGGSSSISNSWDQLRRVGASARALFVSAAATAWRVNRSDVQIRDGVLSHPPTGRQANFGDLLQAASRLTPPADPVLKPPSEYRLLGTSRVTRLDLAPKVTGRQRFTADVQHPDMLIAVVAHSPRFGGRVARFDASQARLVDGVVDVIEISSGVAVVAVNTFAALQGRQAMTVDWDDSAAETRSSEEILQEHREIAADTRPGEWITFEDRGDSREPVADESTGEADLRFDFPLLAHAAMEPMNCVAAVDGRRVRLQYGAQSQTADQRNIAAFLGCEPEEVEITTLHSGGSFGRRSVARSDYQLECVEIASKIGGGRPVKLQWTREDDTCGGEYRPIAHHRIRAHLDTEGYPLEWSHRIVVKRIMEGTALEGPGAEAAVEHQAVEGVRDSPYFPAIPRVHAAVAYTRSPVPVLWLRSVGHTHTAMAMEHGIDRLARRAGIDPVVYRRTLYQRADAGRHLALLNLLAEKSGWTSPLDDGWARGIAVHESFGSVVGAVAEVSLAAGEPKVRRVVMAVDCGIVISPDQVRAQMEGGANYGLSIALFGEVKLDKGVPQTTNFHNYRVLRINEAPDIETHIVPSASPPSGTGEPGTPVIAPAVANALLALTGNATERLPLVRA